MGRLSWPFSHVLVLVHASSSLPPTPEYPILSALSNPVARYSAVECARWGSHTSRTVYPYIIAPCASSDPEF
jgi:hypothetical protein